LTDDRELRKQIAAEAQTDPAVSASAGVRAFQFFLVPLIIVAVCVLVYLALGMVVANPRSAHDWLKDVKEGGPGTRPYATLQLAQAIRRMGEPDRSLTRPILDLFLQTKLSPVDSTEDKVRRYLAHCLGNLRDERASQALLGAALEEAKRKDNCWDAMAACFDALGAIKDPSTLAPLVNLLDDENPVVRKYAAFTVGAVAEKAAERGAAVEGLKKRLADPVADVGWNAALALGFFLGDGSGKDTLKQMLDRKHLAKTIDPKDPQAELLISRTIVGACNAAAKLKDESLLPSLQSLTDDRTEPNSDVRFIAHKAIAAIRAK
jgi:HEAT repeat protein